MGESSDLSVNSATAPDKREKRLAQRFSEAIRERHYSRRTEEAYVIKRFVWFSAKRDPRKLVPDVEADRALIPI